MKERLALLWVAGLISFSTMLLDLRNVANHGLPALDLTLILTWNAAPEIISAVPLKPAMWIILVDPPLHAPHGKWLTRIDPKIIELVLLFSIRRQLDPFEP
ncbi:MAG: hypothetical protein RL141_232 [Candidatus Parcubacteria bacterium]